MIIDLSSKYMSYGKRSVVDWHRFDAYPDQDPNVHFYADPDPDGLAPKRCRSPHTRNRILPPSLTYVGKLEFFQTYSHSIASLQCFNFLISVDSRVSKLSIFWQNNEIFWNTVKFMPIRIRKMMRIRPDPDPQYWEGDLSKQIDLIANLQ
jgi:hypothetical protein